MLDVAVVAVAVVAEIEYAVVVVVVAEAVVAAVAECYADADEGGSECMAKAEVVERLVVGAIAAVLGEAPTRYMTKSENEGTVEVGSEHELAAKVESWCAKIVEGMLAATVVTVLSASDNFGHAQASDVRQRANCFQTLSIMVIVAAVKIIVRMTGADDVVLDGYCQRLGHASGTAVSAGLVVDTPEKKSLAIEEAALVLPGVNRSASF